MAENNNNIFRRLTKLFRSGPVVKRRVRDFEGKGSQNSAFEMFRKNQSTVYNAAMSAYGTYDRMARYSDFSEMEYTPEIASALDIYSEETVAADENGKTLHIFSENPNIKQLLDDLFFDTLNVEFNLTSWVRNLCKYGDFFLYIDVNPEYGIINSFPLAISEVEREEGFDTDNPMAVRFRWVTQGNTPLESWQVAHMRLLGNDAFIPYGSSVLEPARRIWRQLILLEDAMLVYRVVRAPERRVFKIDVGNVPPEDIPNYMEQVQSSLKRAPVIDRSTGRVDLRYNPLSVDEDFFIPVRGSESGTSVDNLGGGTMAGETDDVEYIQKKLFSALKIPKAYLGYDEGLGAKATLSQEDIRFSRTIARIQRTVLSEMNKIAIIHLYCNGYSGEDLLDFTLKLSNPSTIAQQQKLELFTTRFTAAQTALGTPGLVDRLWVQKNILRLTNAEIEAIKRGGIIDKLQDLKVEATQLPEDLSGETGPVSPEGGTEGGDLFGAGDEDLDPPGDDQPPDEDLSEFKPRLSIDDIMSPIKAQSRILTEAKTIDDDNLEEDKEDKEDKEDNDNTPDRTGRKYKKNDFVNHLNLVNPPKDKYKRDPSGMTRLKMDLKQSAKNPLKNAHKDLFESDEITDIDTYLDKQFEISGHMTAQINSILESLKHKTKTRNDDET